MSRVVVVERAFTVSDGSTNQTVNDRRVIPYDKIRSFTINPIVAELTPHTFTAASINAIEDAEVPPTVIAKVRTIQDQTFLGEPELVRALMDAALLTQEELDDHGNVLLEHVERGSEVQRLKQIVAYLELESAPPSSSTNSGVSPLAAAITPVGLVTDFSQLTNFYNAMEEIQNAFVDQSVSIVEITYAEDFP